MKIGFALPNLGPLASTAAVATLAVAGERYGFEHLWVGDHIVLPVHPTTSHYPHGSFGLTGDKPILEPLVTLGYLSALTSGIRLGLSVLIVPYRHPLEIARMLFTLDALSGGRIICGIGAGWLEEEFAMLGASYDERHALTDDLAQLLPRLALEDVVSFDGAAFHCKDIAIFPKPVNAAPIPVWVGGTGRLAMRRAARFGDGWQPTGLTPDELAPRHQVFLEHLGAVERPRSALTVSVRLSCGARTEDAALSGPGLYGSPAQMLESIGAFAAAGADQLVLTLRAGSVAEASDLLSIVGEEVLPAVQP